MKNSILPDKRRDVVETMSLRTFMDLTTVWSYFKLKGSLLILSVSAILILGISCSSVAVEALPSRF